MGIFDNILFDGLFFSTLFRLPLKKRSVEVPHLLRTATPWRAARIRRPATASRTGFRRSSRRAVSCIMGRQQLRQVLAPALFASEFLLLSYNEKLILLTTPLTTVLVNRHIILLPKTENSDSSVRLFCCKFTNPFQKAPYQISLLQHYIIPLSTYSSPSPSQDRSEM